MNVTWLSLKNNEGSASINANCITLNTIAMAPFKDAYRVKVGLDERMNLVLIPLTKDAFLRMCLDENDCFGIQLTKSYARINSKELVSLIEMKIGISFSKESIKFKTKFFEKDNCLVIYAGKGDKK